MKNKKSSLLKLSMLGAILFITSSFIARSLILPIADNMFENCTDRGFYASNLDFECSTTPFITFGLLGGIIFIVLLGLVAKNFNIAKKGMFWMFAGYMIITMALSIFWRDVLIFSGSINELLNPGGQLGADSVRGLPSDFGWRNSPIVIDEVTLSQLEGGKNVGNAFSYLYLWLNIVGGMLLGTILYYLNPAKKKTKAAKLTPSKVVKKAAAKKKTTKK